MSSKLFRPLLALSSFFLVQHPALMGLDPPAAAVLMAPDRTASASDIAHRLHRLGVTTRVLHLAAHPDDENTRLLAYLVNARHMDAAYLSLTRGDGGQNLIGSELRDYLGLIRTQELLAARKIDGAEQFFTRAVDFGYSKTAAETLRIWDHDAVLADTVWVIRNYRPDVIITRFGLEGGFTHGHHTASTILAVEAFEAAGDPRRFPEQLKWVEPFQPTRVVWNTSARFFARRGQEFDEGGLASLQVGDYLPLLGSSPSEISALSRSQHKSQGFGSGASRGQHTEYFAHLAGDGMKASIFDGIGQDWSAYPEGAQINRSARTLTSSFDPVNPAASIPDLLHFRKWIAALPPEPMIAAKLADVDQLIADCLGLHFELRVPEDRLTPRASIPGELRMIQQLSGSNVRLAKIEGPYIASSSPQEALPFNETLSTRVAIELPHDAPYSQPYWLARPHSPGLFTVDDQALIGTPENQPVIAATVTLEIDGVSISYLVPAVKRFVDPVEGEVHSPALIVPPLYANFHDSAVIFPTPETKTVHITIGGHAGAATGRIRLTGPEGWQIEPAVRSFKWSPDAAAPTLRFSVTPSGNTAVGVLKAALEVDGVEYDRSFEVIDYPHIPTQLLMPPAATRVILLDLAHHDERIAYIPGAGDRVVENLRTVGLDVTELETEGLTAEDLRAYDAVILGIRALNTIEGIDSVMPELFTYAKAGGTVILQYNTHSRLKTNRLGPYPLTLSRDRVTDETAEVTFLAPDHRVLNYPNKLSLADFDDWVQERGLYFPSQWDDAYTPILSWHDEGESAMDGSLLVTDYGQGHFVYTGISFFRQLPAGVPGAYRLFVNLLALSHDQE